MKFSKPLNPHNGDAQPPVNKPVPMRPKGEGGRRSEAVDRTDAGEGLVDLKMVARKLGVSPRYVQTLVRRKVIPVIRLGRRCTRFDLDSVLAAVHKFEIQEQGR